MFTIKDKLGFSYNGKHSGDLGVISVSMGGGMFEEALVASRTVNDQFLNGNKYSLYSGVTKEPLSFELTLAFEKNYTDEQMDKLISWMYDVEYFLPMQFDGTDRILYCMPDGGSNIVHTGAKQGYVTIPMKTNSPFVFSPLSTSTTTVGADEITIELRGNKNPETKIEIDVKVSGSIDIVMNGVTVQINNLVKDETLTIYPDTEEIMSSVSNVYHYSDYVGDLTNLRIMKEENTFRVTSRNGDTTSAVRVTYEPYYNK